MEKEYSREESFKHLINVSVPNSGIESISMLFSNDEIKNFNETCSDSAANYSLTTQLSTSEMCLIVLSEILPGYTEDDPILIATERLKDFDLSEYAMRVTSPHSINRVEDSSLSLADWPLFQNREYLHNLCDVLCLAENEQNQVFRIYDEVSATGSANCDIPDCFCRSEEVFKTVFLYNCAASIKREQEEIISTHQEIDEESFISYCRAVRDTVNTIKEKYLIWESSVSDFYPITKAVSSLNQLEGDSSSDTFTFLYSLLLYHSLYSESWQDDIFSMQLNEFCDTPSHVISFVLQLKKHRFSDSFCQEYDRYIQAKGITPLFKTELIKSVVPELKKDTLDIHKDWFARIPRNRVTKFVGINATTRQNEELYRCINKLYNELIQKEYIGNNTPVNLFVYRFTGFLVPQPLDKKILLRTDNINKNYICCLVKILFDTGGGRPPYKTVSDFFLPSLGNISALAKVNNDIYEEVLSLLRECGFVNLE